MLSLVSSRSGPAGAGPPEPARPARPDDPDQRRRPQRHALLIPVQLHISTAESRAIPIVEVRPVHAAQQHHGHRQHLRTGRQTAVQRSGMGQEHSVLPRSPGDRPGCVAEAGLVRTVRAERVPVFDASARSAPACGRWVARVPDGRGQSCGVHGPY